MSYQLKPLQWVADMVLQAMAQEYGSPRFARDNGLPVTANVAKQSMAANSNWGQIHYCPEIFPASQLTS